MIYDNPFTGDLEFYSDDYGFHTVIEEDIDWGSVEDLLYA